MNRIRNVLAGMCAVAFLATAAACGADGSGNNENGTDAAAAVGVGYVQLPIFAPLYVADSKGYFKDEGIDVDLQIVGSGQDSIALAASGKLDAVLSGYPAGFLNSVEGGLDIKVVGSMGIFDGNTERPPSALVVSKKLFDSGELTSVADLEGREIGALEGNSGPTAAYIDIALKEAGVSAKDVTFVNLSGPDTVTALKTGSIDAGFISAPFWNLAVDGGTAVKLWSPPEGTSGTGVLYGGEFLRSSNGQPFFNALARASQDLQGEARYSEENLAIIAEYTGQTPEQVKSLPLYTWYPDLQPTPEELARMEQYFMEAGVLNYSEPLSPDDYIETSFSEGVPSR